MAIHKCSRAAVDTLEPNEMFSATVAEKRTGSCDRYLRPQKNDKKSVRARTKKSRLNSTTLMVLAAFFAGGGARWLTRGM